MKLPACRSLSGVVVKLAFLFAYALSWNFARSQASATYTAAPTLSVSSRLVVVDVAVLDHSGHVVTSGLSDRDFQITEDGQPQQILSFEPPQVNGKRGDQTNEVRRSVASTIFVLDLLNSSFSDFSYARDRLEIYLRKQPPLLNGPCELMLLGNNHLQLVQGYTRDRDEVLDALRQIPAAYPSKSSEAFVGERFMQSVEALRNVGLQNAGSLQRVSIVWLGSGSPSIEATDAIGKSIFWMSRYMRDTANLLVQNRLSLSLIYPGFSAGSFVNNRVFADLSNGERPGHDNFYGLLNFASFIHESGGRFYFASNAVDAEIESAVEIGSDRYTLTYRPGTMPIHEGFRRIHVSVSGDKLHAVYKEGYFTYPSTTTDMADQTVKSDISAAVRSSISFDTLTLTNPDIVRHPDSQTAQFTVNLSLRKLMWRVDRSGHSTAIVRLASAVFSENSTIVSSRIDRVVVVSPTDDQASRDKYVTQIKVVLRMPRKAQRVRFVVEALDSGRIGSLEVSKSRIDQAAEAPTPAAMLVKRSSRF